MLSGLDKILIASLTLVLMVGMGASLTVSDYTRALERPRAILIGLASQFGWMPLLAYLAISWLELEGTDAMGLMLRCRQPRCRFPTSRSWGLWW